MNVLARGKLYKISEHLLGIDVVFAPKDLTFGPVFTQVGTFDLSSLGVVLDSTFRFFNISAFDGNGGLQINGVASLMNDGRLRISSSSSRSVTTAYTVVISGVISY